MEIHCKIGDLKLEKSTISNLVARAKCKISSLAITDSSIYDAHCFMPSNFSTLCIYSWLLISFSAENSKNLSLRAEANYQMAKLNAKNEKGLSSRALSRIFCICTGFGYKPARIFNVSIILIIISGIILNVRDIIIRTENFNFLSRMLFALAAFVGQSGAKIDDGFPFWVATGEYMIGIAFFAMHVNAFYVRYKS